MSKTKILAISGSTRINSTNESILRFIKDSFQESFDLEIYAKLSDLPHFNPDHDKEAAVSPIITELRKKIENADGVIICTPEYVFSLPGALKNALEWTVSTTVFSDKPAALIVASGLGEKTFESLTLIMKTLGAKMGEHSRLLIQGARSKLINGQISDDQTRDEVHQVVLDLLKAVSGSRSKVQS